MRTHYTRPARGPLALAFTLAAVAATAIGARPGCAGDPSTPVVADAAAARIDAAIRGATNGEFWGTVLVARRGETAFVKGYGLADYAKVKNAPDTLFEIASVSKQVTATAILRLDQQKRLALGDSLTRFFPRAPRDKAAITVSHLLHHTAGLSPDLGVPYAWVGSRDAYVERVLAPPLVSTPGEKFAYSNVGYALLAAVVESVTGRDFEDYVRRELFGAAKLRDTGFVGDAALEKSPRSSHRRAAGQAAEGPAAKWPWGWGYRGMGGVVTTALDLLAWDRALRGTKVLDAAHLDRLYEPALEGYACGWFVRTTERGTRKAEHSGGVRGYACLVSRFLEDDVVVIVLSNGETDVARVERAVVATLFAPARVEADLTPPKADRNEFGGFECSEGATIDAVRSEAGVEIRLRKERAVCATIRVPRPYALKVAADVETMLAGRSPEGPDVAPLTVGVYMGMFGNPPAKHLEEGLEIRLLPRYQGVDAEGRAVEDPRILLVLDEPAQRRWSVMAKMGVEAAQALVTSLRAAAK